MSLVFLQFVNPILYHKQNTELDTFSVFILTKLKKKLYQNSLEELHWDCISLSFEQHKDCRFSVQTNKNITGPHLKLS